jgi:hypothetical protein
MTGRRAIDVVGSTLSNPCNYMDLRFLQPLTTWRERWTVLGALCVLLMRQSIAVRVGDNNERFRLCQERDVANGIPPEPYPQICVGTFAKTSAFSLNRMKEAIHLSVASSILKSLLGHPMRLWAVDLLLAPIRHLTTAFMSSVICVPPLCFSKIIDLPNYSKMVLNHLSVNPCLDWRAGGAVAKTLSQGHRALNHALKIGGLDLYSSLTCAHVSHGGIEDALPLIHITSRRVLDQTRAWESQDPLSRIALSIGLRGAGRDSERLKLVMRARFGCKLLTDRPIFEPVIAALRLALGTTSDPIITANDRSVITTVPVDEKKVGHITIRSVDLDEQAHQFDVGTVDGWYAALVANRPEAIEIADRIADIFADCLPVVAASKVVVSAAATAATNTSIIAAAAADAKSTVTTTDVADNNNAKHWPKLAESVTEMRRRCLDVICGDKVDQMLRFRAALAYQMLLPVSERWRPESTGAHMAALRKAGLWPPPCVGAAQSSGLSLQMVCWALHCKPLNRETTTADWLLSQRLDSDGRPQRKSGDPTDNNWPITTLPPIVSSHRQQATLCEVMMREALRSLDGKFGDWRVVEAYESLDATNFTRMYVLVSDETGLEKSLRDSQCDQLRQLDLVYCHDDFLFMRALVMDVSREAPLLRTWGVKTWFVHHTHSMDWISIYNHQLKPWSAKSLPNGSDVTKAVLEAARANGLVVVNDTQLATALPGINHEEGCKQPLKFGPDFMFRRSTLCAPQDSLKNVVDESCTI